MSLWDLILRVRKRPAVEAAPSYLSSRTKTLCTCASNPASAPLRGLLLAARWARPSSPGPDLRRLRRAPGRGRFLHVCCTLGFSPMHNYHCGWPCGVFVASRMTLKPHCGTCADFFGIWNTCGCLFRTSVDLGAPVWLSWASFWHPPGSFFMFFITLGRGPDSFKHFRGKSSKKGAKIMGLGSPVGSILMII